LELLAVGQGEIGRQAIGRKEEKRGVKGRKMADAAADLEEGGVVRTVKDLFAGAAGGIAQVLLGEF
jgi:hypothetical protein